MKTKWIMTAAAVVLMGLGTTAKAIQYSDADAWAATIAAGGTFTKDFNIVTADGVGDTFTVDSGIFDVNTQNGGKTYTSADGYVTGTKIDSGAVNFWFHNSNGDTFNVLVGLDTLLNEVNAGPVVFESKSLNGTLIVDLQADGIINYTVSNAGLTDITFDYALLTANVPDGGTTVMLLGGALASLGLLRKKLVA